ncbi:hypothetical protein RND81_07G137900 [Saponaria officinalis]|uniref:Retrovirus-related Pol polyprotein from transposon TNT 1-94-like beta-barrel domain-containing protein n=1 Tax=Saponaria officinalis TaxID=3572 RepID=A0AAW1JN57_SAPOF
MVFSWILNAVSSEIADSILYSDTAKSAWNELVERYDQSNGAQLYGVHKKLSEFSQGNDCVTTYFTKLKSIWDEIDGMGINPKCTCTFSCGATEKQTKFHEDQRVIQFLMRLNEDYSIIRGTILMQNPLPKLSTVYNNLIQEERQREIRHTVQFQSDSASLYVKSGRSATSNSNNQGISGQNLNFKSRNYSFGSQDVRNTIVCNYFKKPGHTVDRCFRLQNRNRRYANNVHGGDQGSILGAFDAAQGRMSVDNTAADQQGNPNLYEQVMNLLKHSQNHGQTAPGVVNFAGNSTAFSNTLAYSSSWILDSGTSDHMCSNKSLFSEIHIIPKPYSISLPNGHVVTINCVGTVILTPQITLQNVLFVPCFKFNLLSVGKLCKQLNFILLFTPDLCCLQGSLMKTSLILGNNSKDLYLLQ